VRLFEIISGHHPPLPLGMDWWDMSSFYPIPIPSSYYTGPIWNVGIP
jgi:hypothetical protein